MFAVWESAALRKEVGNTEQREPLFVAMFRNMKWML